MDKSPLHSSAHSIEVTLAAIDGGHLVLESENDNIRFRWPLDKIPRPLEIGSRLTLELQKNGVPSVNPSANRSATGGVFSGRAAGRVAGRVAGTDKFAAADKDADMRKLLEDLVN